MGEEVVCPACGRGNEWGMAEAYRVCVHCGADLGTVVAGASPMDELQRSIDGGTPTSSPGDDYVQPQPAQQQPYQQQPYQQQPYQQQPYQQQPYQQQPYQQQPYQTQPGQAPPGQPAYAQPPPSYGQPPPAYGGQPYGGQPYPPPGYGPGPAYPMPIYTQSYHPGLYDKPEQTPYVDIGNLFKLLFRPKEAFEDLYDHTTSTQGSILAIIFIVISGVLGLVVGYVALGTLDLPDDAAVPWVNSSSGIVSIADIFISILAFFLTAWLFHAFVQSKTAHASLSKTIGMMGYAKFPAFIILTIISLLTPLMLLSLGFDPDNPDEAVDAIGSFCGLLALIVGLGILGFFWAIWVHSHAQSVANDVSTGTAFGWLFLAWILVGILTGVVSFVVGLTLSGI